MMNNYRATDPEFMERFEHFAFDEVVNEPGQELEPVTRHMAILASLLAAKGLTPSGKNCLMPWMPVLPL